MKKILFMATCAATLAAVGKFAEGTAPIRGDYKIFAESRRYVVSRVVDGGQVITTWHRNGRPDWILPAVETNALKHIAGVEQFNPLQKLVEQWRATATNNAARVERATAALDKKRGEYVQKRDAATLPTTKAIYQAFIDAIDRIKAKMNGDE